MKKFLAVIALVCLLTVVFHGLLWWQDKDINQKFRAEVMESPGDRSGNIKETRLMLEAKQKEDLKKYKWVNRREGNVQIPIERGIHYYLDSLPHE